MNCPKCTQSMDFVPANQNWWCNPCLAAFDGDAPQGLAGPTANQIASQRQEDSHVELETSKWGGMAWLGIDDIATLVPLLCLVAGGLLLYTGFYVIGGILLGAVFTLWWLLK